MTKSKNIALMANVNFLRAVYIIMAPLAVVFAAYIVCDYTIFYQFLRIALFEKYSLPGNNFIIDYNSIFSAWSLVVVVSIAYIGGYINIRSYKSGIMCIIIEIIFIITSFLLIHKIIYTKASIDEIQYTISKIEEFKADSELNLCKKLVKKYNDDFLSLNLISYKVCVDKVEERRKEISMINMMERQKDMLKDVLVVP